MEKTILERIPIPQVENHYNMTSTSAQYPSPKHGGRVPNINESSSPNFRYKLFADGRPVYGDDPRTDLIGHQHTKTPLNEIFFSVENIDRLQSEIRNQVALMSGGKYWIDRQSDESLRIIMRSYYLMYAKNDPRSVLAELQDLNARVVGYCSGKVYSEVDFHEFYKKDLEEFAPAIANPENVKVYGTRTGELKSFF